MGILSRLFGGGDQQGAAAYRLRAPYKDAKYYLKEIDRFQQWAEQQENNPPNPVTPFYYWSTAARFNKVLELEYSLGKRIDGLVDTYKRSLDHYLKGWNREDPTYEDRIRMIAWGVLLDIPASDFQRLEQYLEQIDRDQPEGWYPDALSWYLVTARQGKPSRDLDKTMYPDIYQPLFDITRLPKAEAEKAVKEYLEQWYELRHETTWYNSHTRDNGFSGYWAWDVAAVVKLMGLDDSSFKDNPVYPYDIVHWRD
jgi:hypothetical protein